MKARVLVVAGESALRAAIAGIQLDGVAKDPSDGEMPALVRFEQYMLDVGAHTLTGADGRERRLTRAELALLLGFLRNAGRVLSRDRLRHLVHGRGAKPYDRSVDMLVVRLRRKLDSGQGTPQLIVTIPGDGYRLALRPNNIKWGDAGGTSELLLGHKAERRHVTVMACQIDNMIAAAEHGDPEELREVSALFYRTCSTAIAPFGGKLIRFLGDQILIFFGYPEATEDHAICAISAGLELRRAVENLHADGRHEILLRIGLASGMVIIGNLVTEDQEEHAPVGLPINLAMQLQSRATPNSILVAHETRELAGRFFEYERAASEGDVEALRQVWRVHKPTGLVGRFSALRQADMGALVGRKEEMLHLERAWRNASAGKGCVVILKGEPGIGKSRLAEAFERQVENKTVIDFHTSSRRADSSLSTVLNELETAAGFSSVDSAEKKLSKLGGMFAGAVSNEKLEALARLLRLRANSEAEFSPQKTKEFAFSALLARFAHLTKKRPVLLRIEDAHWLDPTSLEFFDALVDHARNLRLLILLTARPEFNPQWTPMPHVSVVVLERLGRTEAETLVTGVANDVRLTSDLVAKILQRADGVPLFLEEITKSVVERSRSGDGITDAGTQTRISIPRTLRDSLLSRINRLGPGKDILQLGAVFGREFSYELISAVGSKPKSALDAGLQNLVASGLLQRRGLPPYATYFFKHVLVRDAAYDLMVRRSRLRAHTEIAQTLERRFPETRDTQPEVLGHHWAEGEEAGKAIPYLVAAAQRNVLRSGTAEAIAQLAKARSLLITLPADRGRSETELKLELLLARILTARRSFAAPETREAYRRARESCDSLGDDQLLPLVMLGQWVGAWSGAEYRLARRMAAELHAFGKKSDSASVTAVSNMAFGMTHMLRGQLRIAHGYLTAAAASERFSLPVRPPILFFDANGRVSSLTFLHDCLLLLGFPEQADAVAARAEAIINDTDSTPNQSFSRALVQHHVLRMHTFRRDFHKVTRLGLPLLQLSQEQDYPYFVASSLVFTGWARVHNGEASPGIEQCQQGLALLEKIGVACWRPRYTAMLAECQECAGDIEGAKRSVQEALRQVQSAGEEVWLSEIHRRRGSLLLRSRRSSEAAVELKKALRVAQRQGALIFELRAATDLAELPLGVGRRKDALANLHRIYKRFAERSHHPDLKRARALIANP